MKQGGGIMLWIKIFSFSCAIGTVFGLTCVVNNGTGVDTTFCSTPYCTVKTDKVAKDNCEKPVNQMGCGQQSENSLFGLGDCYTDQQSDVCKCSENACNANKICICDSKFAGKLVTHDDATKETYDNECVPKVATRTATSAPLKSRAGGRNPLMSIVLLGLILGKLIAFLWAGI